MQKIKLPEMEAEDSVEHVMLCLSIPEKPIGLVSHNYKNTSIGLFVVVLYLLYLYFSITCATLGTVVSMNFPFTS
jgi:hypothetical protein